MSNAPAPLIPPDPTFAVAHERWERLERAVRARREADLECAHVLAEMHAHRSIEWLRCASVGELGERSGLSADEARMLFDLGRALREMPLLEQKVREGRITVAAAALVARVLADPGLQRGEDDWIGWAQTETTSQ